MYNDFYLRTSEDPNFIPDVLTVQDEMENLVTQIRMTLLTSKCEVLGIPNFGFSAYDFLFDFNYINLVSVEDGANEQINTHCSLMENHTLSAKASVFKMEKYRDALGLNLDIDNKGSFGVLLD